MSRVPIAYHLPSPLPAAPTLPHPSPSPLQNTIQSHLSSTDYDLVAINLTNDKWQARWDHLCLRPMEDELDPESEEAKARDRARELVDREADVWRKEGGLRREEVNVSRLEETGNMIAIAADWLELDSEDEGIRFDSELALRAEMAQALYLSVPTLIIPAPTLSNRSFLPSYARAIAGLLQMGGPSAYTQISIRIPISDPTELIQQGPAVSPLPVNGMAPPPPPPSATARHHKRMSSLSTRPQSMHAAQLAALAANANGNLSGGANGLQGSATSLAPSGMRNASGASAFSQVSTATARSTAQSASGDPSSTWEMWDTVRAMCGYHPRLSITLDLTNPLPPSAGALSRWTAEPVKHIWLPASSFIPNAKGYPVLSKACQAFLKGLVKNNPTYILSQTTSGRHQAGGSSAYLQYLRHITSQAASMVSTGPNGEIGPGYADYLQAPLQPLMDDLGSLTYDVFERDPVKYRQYEEAILLALSDLPEGIKHTVMVVGAGRGPLVACTLRAMKRANRQASVYAIEKNASAFVTLQERKELEWKDSVEIIMGDMRTITVPQQADIIVSELLGSFADNELSPECLDGAMRFLKPNGISIPMSYTAHVAPLSSAKLHADVLAAAKDPAAAETPYVVMMSQVNVLSGEPPVGSGGRCGERVQQCWLFEHPRRDLILDAAGNPMTNSHNTRSTTNTFYIPHAAPCHGLAGYFEAHLYGNIGLSTQPDSAHRISPDMSSWFPIFFPFRHPIYLPSNSELEVNMWRLCDSRGKKVWYEWSAEAFLPVIQPSITSTSVAASPGAGAGSTSNAGTPVGSLNANSRNSHLLAVQGQAQNGGAPSPMMDAPSPIRSSFGNLQGLGQQAVGQAETRVKIGQTGLHNVGGAHSWVGL